jgi:hypothetical protein
LTTLQAAGTIAGLTLVLLFAGGLDPWTLLALPVVTFLFLGLHHAASWPARRRALFLGFLVVSTAAFAARVVGIVGRNLADLPEWDYLGFWLHARTAVLGQSFYDPANAQILALPHDASPDFMEEILVVGFWYPPPSMFLFLPLGWFEPRQALPWWYAFQASALVLVVFLLWRIFFARGGRVELMGCALLVAVSYGTYTTFRFSQTTFVALLAVLLFWRRRNAAGGGAWLPVAISVKPFLAVLALEPVLARRWRVLAGALLSAGAISLGAALAFGPGSFAEYLGGEHLGAKPAWIYDQPTNQSLLGLVLRSCGARCAGAECVSHPLFVSAALLVGATTLALGWRLQRARREAWALSLYLLMALLVYPVSQVFYSVVLIPPMLVAWEQRGRVAGGASSASITLALVSALTTLANGRATVFAVLLLWIVMMLVGLRLVQGGGWPVRDSPP